MGDTILGDVSIVQPAQPQSRSLSPLLAAALGAALPGVGAAGYFANQVLNQVDPPPIAEGVDTSVKLELGKLSDYLDAPIP